MAVKQYTLSQITAELGGEVRGEDVSVCAVWPLAQVGTEYTSFLANPKYKHEVHDSKADVVIVPDRAAGEFTDRNLIVAADLYLYLVRVARLFLPVAKARGGVYSTAVVEPSVTVPDSCETGTNAYIGANAVLGEGCRILANVAAQHDCKLGSEVVLHPNAVVHYSCMLGSRVEIHSGAVIGANGFGLVFAGDSWFRIPQTGAVTPGDDVETGSNSNIDRGAMSDTTVGSGTKIDSQVQTGHNCEIDPHTVIAAKTGISGSVTIGNYCIIGGGASTVGHIETVNKTTIDGGTSVIHSITESGQHVTGILPMSSYKEWARNVIHIHRLNETGKRTKQLEQRLAEPKDSKQAI